jgi:enamine deaminase RidA (YjgF/YER057c/UK114 family)
MASKGVGLATHVGVLELVKSFINDAGTSIEEKDLEDATEQLKGALAEIDRALEEAGKIRRQKENDGK